MQTLRIGSLLLLARMLRKLPAFRGRGRLAALLNRPLLNALPPTEVVRGVRMRDGSYMKVDLRSATEWISFYSGEYDGQVESVFPFIPDKCSIIDVGANIGFWTIPLGRHLQKLDGICYGFEPVPANFERLRHNIAQNGLESTVRSYPLALGEKNDDIVMVLDTSDGALTGNAARVPHAAYEDGQRERTPIAVKLRRLDDIAAEIGLDQRRCAFMKVDIEGCEPFFLRGAADFIQRHQPVMLMEINRVWLARNRLGIEDYLHILCPQCYRMHLWCAPAWSEIADPNHLGALHDIETALFIPRNKQKVDALSLGR